MRKTVLLLMTLCLPVAAHADFVTVDQAKAKAAAFLTKQSKSKKQIQAFQLRLSNPSPRKSPALTTSSKPCYYIFNSPDSTGFVIVSAESSTIEILAYSNEGYFHTEDIDKGAEVFLNQYTKDIEQVRSDGLTAEQKAYVSKVNKASSDGDVLLKTANFNQWDGDWDTKYCPLTDGTYYAPCGCVATAAAIIMHYHKWPATGKGCNSYVSATRKLSLNRDFSQDTYDWDCIPYTSYYEDDSAWTDKAKDEIGKIELACGIACSMDYDYGGSSAYETNMVTAMIKNFSYSVGVNCYYDMGEGLSGESWQAARNSIDNNMPVMACGNGDRGPHAFVLDGYNSSYYHYNMGWGGGNNGWFVNGSISDDNYSLYAFYTDIHPQTGEIVESGTTSNGINYSLNDDGVLKLSGNGSVPSLSNYITYPILECNIAGGITGIDNQVFSGVAFSKIIIPSTLTTLGEGVFEYTNDLVDIEVDPRNPVYSSPNNNCLYDKTTNTIIKYSPQAPVTFPEGVKNIGRLAFEYTTATSVDIPDGVETIGVDAFAWGALQEIHVPSTLTRIDDIAFNSCPIKKFTCDALYPPRLGYVFKELSSDAVLYVPYNAIDSYKNDIGWSAFSTIIAIPCSENWDNPYVLTVAVSSAGMLSSQLPTDCSNIRELIISGDINGDDIKAIRSITEESVSKISVLNMRDAHIVKGGGYYTMMCSVSDDDIIPPYMLNGCRVDKWIMPSSIKTIRVKCLPNGLTSIDLPDGLKKICDEAFYSSSLASLTIPASVEEIGERTVGCSYNLAKLEVDPANTHYKSIDNTIFSIDGKIAVASIFRKDDDLVLPDGVETIYSYTYADGQYRTVTLPASITSIGGVALTSSKLTTVTCLATTPPTLEGSSFRHSRLGYITVYVPENSVSAYKSATNWMALNIVGVDFTGIDTIFSDAETNGNQRIYTITGMPVTSSDSLHLGLYIKNGKKILIK